MLLSTAVVVVIKAERVAVGCNKERVFVCLPGVCDVIRALRGNNNKQSSLHVPVIFQGSKKNSEAYNLSLSSVS